MELNNSAEFSASLGHAERVPIFSQSSPPVAPSVISIELERLLQELENIIADEAGILIA